jgi:hypothetical protein
MYGFFAAFILGKEMFTRRLMIWLAWFLGTGKLARVNRVYRGQEE